MSQQTGGAVIAPPVIFFNVQGKASAPTAPLPADDRLNRRHPRPLASSSAMSPLKLLHDEDTVRWRAGYGYWMRHSTDDIVDSLRPDGGAPLIVDDQGLVCNGNTRIFVLPQPGCDVISLPGMAKPRPPMGDLDDHYWCADRSRR